MRFELKQKVQRFEITRQRWIRYVVVELEPKGFVAGTRIGCREVGTKYVSSICKTELTHV